MQITGKVLNVSVRGKRYAFLVGENWISSWLNADTSEEFKDAITSVKEGQEYEFDCFSNKGKDGKEYININSVLPIEQQGVSANAETKAQPKTTSEPSEEHQRTIAPPAPDETKVSIRVSVAAKLACEELCAHVRSGLMDKPTNADRIALVNSWDLILKDKIQKEIQKKG